MPSSPALSGPPKAELGPCRYFPNCKVKFREDLVCMFLVKAGSAFTSFFKMRSPFTKQRPCGTHDDSTLSHFWRCFKSFPQPGPCSMSPRLHRLRWNRCWCLSCVESPEATGTRWGCSDLCPLRLPRTKGPPIRLPSSVGAEGPSLLRLEISLALAT